MLRRIITTLLCVLMVAAVFPTGPAFAQAQTERRGASGQPLPRFAIIQADRARMRVGPGFNYATRWIYKRAGLPVEIIEEYGTWRQVRDSDGTTGWMHVSVLSSTRNAMVAPWLRNSEEAQNFELQSSPNVSARTIAQIEPGVILRMKECDGTWCEVEVKGVSGYIQQDDLWGAYPGEAFN